MKQYTHEQIAKMERQELLNLDPIKYCSATEDGDTYKALENVTAHHRVLQNIPYTEYDGVFEVLYSGKWRKANRADFIFHN